MNFSGIFCLFFLQFKDSVPWSVEVFGVQEFNNCLLDVRHFFKKVFQKLLFI